MKPSARGRIDVLRHVGGKSDYIVVQRALELLATFERKCGLVLHAGKILARDKSLSAEGFAGEQLDLQPDFQLALLAPNLPHFRPRIPLNHGEIRNENLKLKKAKERTRERALQIREP